MKLQRSVGTVIRGVPLGFLIMIELIGMTSGL
jgi:hypothetical protein